MSLLISFLESCYKFLRISSYPYMKSFWKHKYSDLKTFRNNPTFTGIYTSNIGELYDGIMIFFDCSGFFTQEKNSKHVKIVSPNKCYYIFENTDRSNIFGIINRTIKVLHGLYVMLEWGWLSIFECFDRILEEYYQRRIINKCFHMDKIVPTCWVCKAQVGLSK